MSNKELDVLQAEINHLKAEIANIDRIMEAHARDVTDHIKYIYKYLKTLDDRSVDNLRFHNEYIANLYDIVEPIEQKIFPGVSKARRQLAALTEKAGIISRRQDEDKS